MRHLHNHCARQPFPKRKLIENTLLKKKNFALKLSNTHSECERVNPKSPATKKQRNSTFPDGYRSTSNRFNSDPPIGSSLRRYLIVDLFVELVLFATKNPPRA